MKSGPRSPYLVLMKPLNKKEPDRRRESEDPDIDRRSQKDRREQIVARGYFEQYFNLYNMMYESPAITPQINRLLSKILDDPEWQAVLAQEVSMDRHFNRKKDREGLRTFFRKYGVIEKVKPQDEIKELS